MSRWPLPQIPCRLAGSIGAAALLCSACGTATTGLDERCADLAATGYNPPAQIQALLQAAKQPTAGDPAVQRKRAKAFCEQLGSGNLAKP